MYFRKVLHCRPKGTAATCHLGNCGQVRMSKWDTAPRAPLVREAASLYAGEFIVTARAVGNLRVPNALHRFQFLANKKDHTGILMPMRPSFLASLLSLVPGGALQARASSVFWLMHWEAKGFCAWIPPSQVSPVTGLLHEYKLLHLQQQAKLRTLTGFPNHRTCRLWQS